jgi:hypothetical protein
LRAGRGLPCWDEFLEAGSALRALELIDRHANRF